MPLATLAGALYAAGGLTDINFVLTGATIVLFAVFALVLAKFAWGPLLHMIEEREKGIKDAVDGAERSAAEAKELLEKHREMLREAGREREEIIKRALKEADVLKTDLQTKARSESEAMIGRAKEQVERENRILELFSSTSKKFNGEAIELVYSFETKQEDLVSDWKPDMRPNDLRIRWSRGLEGTWTTVEDGIVLGDNGEWLHKAVFLPDVEMEVDPDARRLRQRTPGIVLDCGETNTVQHVGVIFVHGIGSQAAGETLRDWGGSIIRVLSQFRIGEKLPADPVVTTQLDPTTGKTLYIELELPAITAADGTEVPKEHWVLTEACRVACDTLVDPDTGRSLPLFVNLSPRQLADTDLVPMVRDVIDLTGVSPGVVHLEITEDALMADAETTSSTLDSLRALGVHLALDDFGTGHSSLAQLRRFPLDVLKIDRSFVRDITTSGEDRAITSAIVSMARQLGIEVVAEGVETAEQSALLSELGCDQLQGFFFGAPSHPDEIARMLRSSGRKLPSGNPTVS